MDRQTYGQFDGHRDIQNQFTGHIYSQCSVGLRDSWTDRQTENQTNGKKDRQTNGHLDRKTKPLIQYCRLTEVQSDKQTDRRKKTDEQKINFKS